MIQRILGLKKARERYIEREFIRLVSVVVSLYLNLTYVMLVFFLHLAHQRSSSMLQYLTHSHISLLSSSQYHHFRLNHFRIYFMRNEFEKIN
jgi:hypothetical protein